MSSFGIDTNPFLHFARVTKYSILRNMMMKLLGNTFRDYYEASRDNTTTFEQLYTQWFQPIYRYFFFRVRDYDIAMDLCQQVFLKLYQSQDRVIAEQEHRYLYTIARNTLIDYLRKKKSIIVDDPEWFQSIASNDEDPESIVDTMMTIRDLREVLSQIPEAYQEVITLRFLQDLSYAEIADIISKSEPAVRKMVSRGLVALRNRMETYSIN